MDNNQSYERDETIARTGKLLGNLALAVSVCSVLPAFFVLTASVLSAIYVIFYFVFFFLAIVFTFGIILINNSFAGGPEAFLGGLESFFEAVSGFLPVYMPVTGAVAAVLAAGAIIVGVKTRGTENSKGVVGKGIAAVVLAVIAIIMTLVVLASGGGAA